MYILKKFPIDTRAVIMAQMPLNTQFLSCGLDEKGEPALWGVVYVSDNDEENEVNTFTIYCVKNNDELYFINEDDEESIGYIGNFIFDNEVYHVFMND